MGSRDWKRASNKLIHKRSGGKQIIRSQRTLLLFGTRRIFSVLVSSVPHLAASHSQREKLSTSVRAAALQPTPIRAVSLLRINWKMYLITQNRHNLIRYCLCFPSPCKLLAHLRQCPQLSCTMLQALSQVCLGMTFCFLRLHRLPQQCASTSRWWSVMEYSLSVWKCGYAPCNW